MEIMVSGIFFTHASLMSPLWAQVYASIRAPVQAPNVGALSCLPGCPARVLITGCKKNRIYHNIWDPVLAIFSISCTMCVVKKPDDPLNTDEGQDLIMELNKSQKISWIPMIVVAAATFVSALDATFMNVSMSQVVADLNTDVATIQKMVTFLYADNGFAFAGQCQAAGYLPANGRFSSWV